MIAQAQEYLRKEKQMNKFWYYLVFSIYIVSQLNAQIYVAPDGDDSNPGTIEQPFGTIAKAISVLNKSDTIFVRGGTYIIYPTIQIYSSKSGTVDSLYHIFAYNNEKPLLDFSSQNSGLKGFSLNADYWHFKGLNIKGAGDNGIQINGGSYNIIEQCTFFENRDSGVQLSNGASYNQIINCDSYYNADPTDYGDADGFAPKLDVGTGNYFYGCRAWGNCDDGWDGYMRGATDVSTYLENCWTWGNGYLEDGTDPGAQANGNGFKMGGGDNSNALELMHHHTLKNCLAFNNKNKGFDQNNNVGSMTLLNCTGYNNGAANYRIKKELISGQTLTVKNCVSFEGSVELGSFAIQETNSWLDPFNVTEDDFVSLIDSQASAPRKSDGSLPDMDFLFLAQGSDLIDAGVDLDIPYFGSAPDLGVFESNYISNFTKSEPVPAEFSLSQNYPNPFNPVTTIRFTIPENGFVSLQVFDISGRIVASMINDRLSEGEHKIQFNGSHFSSGVYYYRIECGNLFDTKKMVLLK